MADYDVLVLGEINVDLILRAEEIAPVFGQERLGLPLVSCEVGSEEVHGGLVDLGNSDQFLTGLQARLESVGLAHAR